MQRRIFTLIVTSIFGLSAMAMSGCGVKGDLKTPPPIWGDQDKQQEPEGESKD